jgi:hypothetical protein
MLNSFGLGVEKNEFKAAVLLQSAGDLGEPRAYLQLGMLGGARFSLFALFSLSLSLSLSLSASASLPPLCDVHKNVLRSSLPCFHSF